MLVVPITATSILFILGGLADVIQSVTLCFKYLWSYSYTEDGRCVEDARTEGWQYLRGYIQHPCLGAWVLIQLETAGEQ